MTKQPILTNFPPSVFATAARRLQASIRRSRQRLLANSLNGLAVMFDQVLPAAFLERIDPTVRQRSFGHIPVFWAWLMQLLDANASCRKAVSLIQSWYRSAGLPVPAAGTGAYCQARLRLESGFLESVHCRILEVLDQRERGEDRWRGLRLKAIDGSSLQLADTAANQAEFPQPSSQKPGCGFPVMGITGILNLGHGGWEVIETANHREHEALTAKGMIHHLNEGDLLLADRGFCSYELIAQARRREVHVLMRLHQARHRALDWRKGRRLSRNSRLVVWNKPSSPPADSPLSAGQWDALPERMPVRLIKMRAEDRSGNLRDLVVVTTLLDPKCHPDDEVIDLYARRWEIELKLRDLKTTLGLEFVDVRSPAMARKTVLMMMIACNLLRVLMQAAAGEAGCHPWEMSFKGVLDLTMAQADSFREFACQPRKRCGHRRQFVALCAQRTLLIRPFRTEPRATKRRPKPHARLTAHRSVYQEIPHREQHRKAA